MALPQAAPRGHLVLVGGGPTPRDVFVRTLSYAGGRRAIVAVVPQTFPDDSIADRAVAMWRTFGVRDVTKASRTDPDEARRALERATLIWMPGGYPSYLMSEITGTPIPDIIRRRAAAGVTVGGASAGAMVMSAVMIADEQTPDGNALDGPETQSGLGLWPEAIVSAHFSERRRLPPLVAILKHHPTRLGIGIDEGTAVVFSDGAFEVMGAGTVVVVDANDARTRTLRAGGRLRIADRGAP